MNLATWYRPMRQGVARQSLLMLAYLGAVPSGEVRRAEHVQSPVLPPGPYRIAVTISPSAGAPAITRRMSGMLERSGSGLVMHVDAHTVLRGEVSGGRAMLRTANSRSDTLALAFTVMGTHAVGTVMLSAGVRRASGTATLDPVPAGGGHGSATMRSGGGGTEGGCSNALTCLLRDLWGIVFDTSDQ